MAGFFYHVPFKTMAKIISYTTLNLSINDQMMPFSLGHPTGHPTWVL